MEAVEGSGSEVEGSKMQFQWRERRGAAGTGSGKPRHPQQLFHWVLSAYY